MPGRNPYRQRVANAREIGEVFGQRTQLWWGLALIESLSLIGKIYEVPPTRYRALLAQFGANLGLDDLLHIPVRQMSLGQKTRASLAATLIHKPRVIYLDEPTIGIVGTQRSTCANHTESHNFCCKVCFCRR